MTDEVNVPMAMLGIALLLYVGFFKAAKEWIQARVGGSGNATPSGPPESKGNPKDTPQPPLGSTIA